MPASTSCDTCAFWDKQTKVCDFKLVPRHPCCNWMVEKTCYLCIYCRKHSCIVTGRSIDSTTEQCEMAEVSIEHWRKYGRS